MNVTEVLQLVDRLVEKKTGKHLDDLQKNIIQGLWEGKTYERMAQDIPGKYNDNYIGEVSRKLFKSLSEELDEDIRKANFCWTLERVINSPQFVASTNSEVNDCPDRLQADEKNETYQVIKRTPKYYDLEQAPKIRKFCDRTRELNILSDWVHQKGIPLVSVVGLPGIGKTTLVKQWIDLNRESFEAIVWENLKICSCLSTIMDEILTAKNDRLEKVDYKFKQLFNLFAQRRCLIVIDDLQEIFMSGKLAGQYKPEYKIYRTFLNKLKETEHQSTVILISQEQCQEMIELDEELYRVKCLELQGLENTAILNGLGLSDRASDGEPYQQDWRTLVEFYQGHPAYLQQVAYLIKMLFLGNVSDFLNENTLAIAEEMNSQVAEIFQRLSPTEQQISIELSKSDFPMSREDLRESLSLSSIDLINGLVSLKRRYIINSTPSFDLFPVFREGIKRLIE